MATRGKRAAMPPPGGLSASGPSDSAPPPLPARRPPPPIPQSSIKVNAAEESASDEDDSYEEPSGRIDQHNDSQELYDEFSIEDEGPPVSPYNPVTNQAPVQQEIYDEFEEVKEEEVYEDPDESPVPAPTKSASSSGNPPPLPPMDNRRRGSIPLPPTPVQKARDLPPPPQDTDDDSNDEEQSIYEPAEEYESDEDSNPAPPPPPLPAGRPNTSNKPPPPARKTEEKKPPTGASPMGMGMGMGIGAIDIKGALKGLRKVSTGENKTVEDKKNKDENNKNAKEALPFDEKKTYFAAKAKDGGLVSEGHHSNGDKNNNIHSRPLPPAKDHKPKLPPMVPKLPSHAKEEANDTPNVGRNIGGVQSLITELQKKPEPPAKPSTTPKPDPKPKIENGGVKTVQLTPRKPPPPSPEEFPPPPSFDDDDQEIYDDASSQDLDPLAKFPWYHGVVERKQGERLLRSIGKDGTFLIRKSTKGQDQPYTMAVLYQDRVNNLKVRLRDDKRIALGEAKHNEISFKDVEGMVEHHKKHPVLLIGTQKGEITLQGSPYKS